MAQGNAEQLGEPIWKHLPRVLPAASSGVPLLWLVLHLQPQRFMKRFLPVQCRRHRIGTSIPAEQASSDPQVPTESAQVRGVKLSETVAPKDV